MAEGIDILTLELAKKYTDEHGGGSPTAENVSYDSTLAQHTSGSVGEALSSQSGQIVALQKCGLTVVNGKLCITYER